MQKERIRGRKAFSWRYGTAIVGSISVAVYCCAAVAAAVPCKGPFGAEKQLSLVMTGQADIGEAIAKINLEELSGRYQAAVISSNRSIRLAKKEKVRAATSKTPAEREEESADQAGAFAVIAIGDSVMLGAKRSLEQEIKGIRVDAVVSRQFREVVRIVKSLRAKHELPSRVIVHGGTNGNIESRQFRELMEALRDCERVVVFNLRVPRPWQKENNELIERVVSQYKNVVLVDWHDQCLACNDILYKDGIHIKNQRGATCYASLAKKALMEQAESAIN